MEPSNPNAPPVNGNPDRSGDCPVDSHPVRWLEAQAGSQGVFRIPPRLKIGARLTGRARQRACQGVRRTRKQSSGLFSRRTPEQTCEGRVAGAARFVAGQIGQEGRDHVFLAGPGKVGSGKHYPALNKKLAKILPKGF